jgi:hypothetical protein
MHYTQFGHNKMDNYESIVIKLMYVFILVEKVKIVDIEALLDEIGHFC